MSIFGQEGPKMAAKVVMSLNLAVDDGAKWISAIK